MVCPGFQSNGFKIIPLKNRGTVHETGDRTKFIAHPIDQRLRLAFLRQVCVETSGTTTGAPDFLDQLSSRVGRAVVMYRNGPALLCEPFGDSAADANRRSGYEGNTGHDVARFVCFMAAV